MIARLGFVGVGHFAGYMVEGLRRAPGGPDILLSPRGAAQAQRLADRFGLAVAADNQGVVDGSDLVVLTVRPTDVAAVAGALAWRTGQRVISMAAGVSLATVAAAVAPATAFRGMGVSSVALGESPTVIHPDDAEVQALLARLGPVHAMEKEADIEVASVVHAYYAWMFGLVEVGARWCVDQGIEPALAREMVAGDMRGAAGMILRQKDESLADIVTSLATPGGTSECGFASLAETDALGAFYRAMDAVLAKLRAGR